MPQRKRKSITFQRRKRVSSATSTPENNESDVRSATPFSQPYSVEFIPPVSRKRKKSQIESLAVDKSKKLKLSSATVKPRIKYVSEETIRQKWRILPEHVQDRVKDLFTLAERPVVTSSRGERKRQEAQATVGSIIRTLWKRLPRMPFPPNTKDTHFDYEALLKINLDLDRRLTATQHSIALIETEIVAEQRFLAQENRLLNVIEVNSKVDGNRRQSRASKRHKLLRVDGGSKCDGPDEIGLVKSSSEFLQASRGDLLPDSQEIMAQLQSHLESIANDTARMASTSEALTKGQVAPDDRLFRRLTPRSYSAFALGVKAKI